MTDVLLFCALHPGDETRPPIYPATADGIAAQLKTPGVRVDYAPDIDAYPEQPGFPDILAKYRRARLMLLEGGYDALLTVESDMILPDDALERLLEVKADVVYGLYCSRRAPYPWLIFGDDERSGLRRIREPEAAKAWGYTLTSCGAGLGCTLIRRRALEMLDFRMAGDSPPCDWHFSIDAMRAGMQQAHDLRVICGHILGDGKAVFPDPFGPAYHRMERV